MSQMRNVALIRVFRLSLQTFEALERWIGSWFGLNPSKFVAFIAFARPLCPQGVNASIEMAIFNISCTLFVLFNLRRKRQVSFEH